MSEKRHVAQQIAAACSAFGVFLVAGMPLGLHTETLGSSGPSQGASASIVSEISRFFSLPDDLKSAVSAKNSKDHRGWARTDDRSSGEYREWMYLGDPAFDAAAAAGKPTPYSPSQWLPESDLPGWRGHMEQLFGIMSGVGQILFRAFSLALNREEEYLETKYGREPTLLLLRYPELSPEDPSREGCPAHSDVGFLAVNLQSDAGGLEIKLKTTGEWAPVPFKDGTFLCHIGDALERVTNGRWHSVSHRVIHKKSGYRFGAVMFQNPAASSVIEPMAEYVPSGEEPRWMPVEYQALQRERLGDLKY